MVRDPVSREHATARLLAAMVDKLTRHEAGMNNPLSDLRGMGSGLYRDVSGRMARWEHNVKQDLQAWLAAGDFKRILDAFAKSPRTLGTLISSTYSEDPLVCWRAIDAVGRIARQNCPARPEVFRNYLQRLFWMMSDEAGIVAPHAPEIIGEIVRSDTKEFGEYISLTVSLLNLEPEDLPLFLPGILYALWRIGEAVPTALAEACRDVEASLSSNDPQARAMAMQCLSLPDYREVLLLHPELATDTGKARIYREGRLHDTSIARLYREISPREVQNSV